MNVDQSGIDLIKDLEGCENFLYIDLNGLATIGVGHLLTKAERDSTTISIDGRSVSFRGGLNDVECGALLHSDLKRFVKCVDDNISVNINQREFNALVSLCFNIGEPRFVSSTVLRWINEGRNIKMIHAAFRLWNKPNLARRRNIEIAHSQL